MTGASITAQERWSQTHIQSNLKGFPHFCYIPRLPCNFPSPSREKSSLQSQMDSSASFRNRQQHPSSTKDSMDLGSTLTVFLLAMVAGWSSSVIFFHVTWFKIRTWLRKRGKERLLGQSSPHGFDERGRKHFSPFHQSCQWPGTGCWDSRQWIWCLGATRRHGRRRAAAHRGSTARPCTETHTELKSCNAAKKPQAGKSSLPNSACLTCSKLNTKVQMVS